MIDQIKRGFEAYSKEIVKKRDLLIKEGSEIFILFSEGEFYNMLFFEVIKPILYNRNNITEEYLSTEVNKIIWDKFMDSVMYKTDTQDGVGAGELKVCIEFGYLCGRIYGLDEISKIAGKILFNLIKKGDLWWKNAIFVVKQ